METEPELKRSDLPGPFTSPQVTQGSGRVKWPGRIQNWVPCTPQPFLFKLQQKLSVTLLGKEIAKCAAQVEGPAAV